jgi:tetratricopeptide (TPR) repeat protein
LPPATFAQPANARSALESERLAGLLWEQGNSAEAKRLWEEWLAVHREIGNEWLIYRDLQSIGDALGHEGNLSEAMDRFQEAIAVCRRTGSKSEESYMLAKIGRLTALQGDPAAAKGLYRRSAAVPREARDKDFLSFQLGNVAEQLIQQGEFSLDGLVDHPAPMASTFGRFEVTREWPASEKAPPPLASGPKWDSPLPCAQSIRESQAVGMAALGATSGARRA